MPNQPLTPSSQNPQEKEGVGMVASQQLSILLQRAMGADTTPNFTEAQVDEMLSQRREISKYIYDDKKQDSKDSKFNLIVVLIFILLFSGGVLIYKPELFSQVLSFLAGLFGGGLGGYGWAKSKR